MIEDLLTNVCTIRFLSALLHTAEWVYGNAWVPNAWDFKAAMLEAHWRFGIAPFFRVSLRRRTDRPPFGAPIIAVGQGDVGLPGGRQFYNRPHSDRVVQAYKMLARDWAINFGTVAAVANKFADEMFHFEQRLVNLLPVERRGVVVALGELQRLAPRLPLYEVITTMFGRTRLDDRTPVWVEDAGMLREMSILVSTTDAA